MEGKVKFFNETKGYGFITGKDGKDIFFHFTGTLDKVVKEDNVDYEIESGQKGPKAINVKRIKT